MRVLLVEDSKILQKTIGTALRRHGYSVDVAGDGEEGLWSAGSGEYDAIILDIMLPKKDGLEVLRELRKSGRDVHVLMLTARDGVDDRVRGLRDGADDYLSKPFAIEELLARVEALCRRHYGAKSPVAEVGGLRIEFATRKVSRGPHDIALTGREYRLLEYLARRRGEVVTRTEIETHIYDGASDLMSNAVNSAISTLRKKLTCGGEFDDPISTRRGSGYVLGDGRTAP